MLRIRPVPFEAMDEGMRALVQASDEALGGSEWLQNLITKNNQQKGSDNA
jgi:hypothetical protein